MLVLGRWYDRIVCPSAKVAAAVPVVARLATVTLQSQLALPPDNVTVPLVAPVMLFFLTATRSGHWMVMLAMTVVFGLVLARSTLSTPAVALPAPHAVPVKVAAA